MKTKYTPGPWTIVNTGMVGLGEVICEVGRGQDIDPRDEDSLFQIGRMCDWGGWDESEAAANARLIAAAPEMAEALHKIMFGMSDRELSDALGLTADCVRECRAALEKAGAA